MKICRKKSPAPFLLEKNLRPSHLFWKNMWSHEDQSIYSILYVSYANEQTRVTLDTTHNFLIFKNGFLKLKLWFSIFFLRKKSSSSYLFFSKKVIVFPFFLEKYLAPLMFFYSKKKIRLLYFSKIKFLPHIFDRPGCGTP